MTGQARTFSFFVGLHQPADAQHFAGCCISINRLRGRRRSVECAAVLIDSAAFTELARFGAYRHAVDVYAAELFRLWSDGVVRIAAVVAQDYMCEPFMLAKTGLSVAAHQRLTIERYDALLRELTDRFAGAVPFAIMPVLQGYDPADYVRHLTAYGDRLGQGMWVGVGSVCKRNGSPHQIVEVLAAIRAARPDLRLHGFGVKKTALQNPGVRAQLDTADSMAWSFAARRQGRDANACTEARAFEQEVLSAAAAPPVMWQLPFSFSSPREAVA